MTRHLLYKLYLGFSQDGSGGSFGKGNSGAAADWGFVV
jgi:hypothetical protein